MNNKIFGDKLGLYIYDGTRWVHDKELYEQKKSYFNNKDGIYPTDNFNDYTDAPLGLYIFDGVKWVNIYHALENQTISKDLGLYIYDGTKWVQMVD